MSTHRPRQTENALIKSAEELARRDARPCSRCKVGKREPALSSWCRACRNAANRAKRKSAP